MFNRGRKRIYSSYSPEEINAETVAKILADSLQIHQENAADIDYLYNYTKGEQPVLNRTKQNRPEICNKIVENHAYEIVEFKTGYTFGQPVTYVASSNEGNPDDKSNVKEFTADESNSNKVNQLNTLCMDDNKPNSDRALGDWLFECGIGYKSIFPLSARAMRKKEKGAPPFHVSICDPRTTFCVYSTDMEETKLLSVCYNRRHSFGMEDVVDITAYTDDTIYSASVPYSTADPQDNSKSTNWIAMVCSAQTEFTEEPNPVGINPIVEYVANTQRMGAFEPVLSMLDAMNETTSNREDGVEQFIQSFVKFVNCDIDEDTFTAMKELGAIKVQSNGQYAADVSIISSELNQDQTQTLIEDMYDKVLAITGVPDRRASAGGNTGQALVIGQGWTNAESRAQSFEQTFKKSERETLRVILNILKGYPEFGINDLTTLDIAIKFTRNRTDNILNKTSALVNMENAGIHPRIAIASCDLFSDPQGVYEISKEYLDKVLNKQQTERVRTEAQQEQAAGKPKQMQDNNAEQDAQNKANAAQ